MRRAFSFIVGIFLFSASTVLALDIKAPLTEGEYYQLCNTPKNNEVKAFCQGLAYVFFIYVEQKFQGNAARICERKYYEKQIRENKINSDVLYKKLLKGFDHYEKPSSLKQAVHFIDYELLGQLGLVDECLDYPIK